MPDHRESKERRVRLPKFHRAARAEQRGATRYLLDLPLNYAVFDQGKTVKTTFVIVWASWCGPCRAELPYVEKLYQQFRNRDDVAVLAFNVDDDSKLMTTALQELKVALPSIAARDFAYSVVAQMALPANWIITPSKTEMFQGDDSTHEAWLASAARAIEKAAGK